MTDRTRIDGQAAFVTGGGGGIGRAIALRLAEAGADVAIFDIFAERAEEAAARVRERGQQAIAIAGDVMDSEALRAAKLLSAAVPKSHGGEGAGLLELGAQCAALAQGCGSSGMVLAMHHIQVACIARHGAGTAYFDRYMRENLVARQEVVASITSENGTFGDTRSSICAVQVNGDRMTLEKDATTVSYGAHADAQLVTCRRAPDAQANDQVLVLFEKGHYTLDQNGTWDTLGMRGTCSPGAKFAGSGAADQILPGSFADSSAQTMVPYSHVLWSALWSGIGTFVILKIVGTLVPLRVRAEDEIIGLDVSQHGEALQ